MTHNPREVIAEFRESQDDGRRLIPEVLNRLKGDCEYRLINSPIADVAEDLLERVDLESGARKSAAQLADRLQAERDRLTEQVKELEESILLCSGSCTSPKTLRRTKGGDV